MRNKHTRVDRSWWILAFFVAAVSAFAYFGLWVACEPAELILNTTDDRSLPKLKSMVCLKGARIEIPEGAPTETLGETTVVYDPEVLEVRCGRRVVKHEGEDLIIQNEGGR